MIFLSYIAVHQIFQLAVAAHEMDELDQLCCSLIAADGKWGSALECWHKAPSLRPMGLAKLPPEKLTEIALPILLRQLRQRLQPKRRSDYFQSNVLFDRLAARHLARSRAQVYVGAETCALDCMVTAGEMGMKRVLDCPGIHAEFLSDQVTLAGEALEIPTARTAASARMNDRRARERAQADVICFCSEFQRQSYAVAEIPQAKIRINPLWVDSLFHGMPPRIETSKDKPLRVLFVGTATLGKGAPFALQAMEMLGDRATLTLCGGVDSQVRQWAGSRLERHHLLGWKLRHELPEVYAAHDVLIFPTLGDSFGFVALEAMACGLPVVTTVHAGAPVPDEAWRAPVRDASALAERLLRYADDRSLLAKDAATAQQFANQFTPEAFRSRAQAIFREQLS